MTDILERYKEKLREGDLSDDDLGCIITLEPTLAQREAIARPGGLSVENIHLTLCFVNSKPLEDVEAIRAVIENQVQSRGPLSGACSGYAQLGQPDSPAWALLVNVLGLNEFRARLTVELRRSFVEYATNYDFLPHISVSYGERRWIEADEWENLKLDFEAVTLRNGRDVEMFPFFNPLLEAEPNPVRQGTPRPDPTPGQAAGAVTRLGTSARRSMSRPGVENPDFDPFLHPRNRLGKFRDVNNKIRDMQAGSSIDVFRFVKRAALPGITSGRLVRTINGYTLSLRKGDEYFSYQHGGPMSRDDLMALIQQAESELDFSQLSVDERRELGLPVGLRPGQNLTEEGTLQSKRGSPKVDAVVIEQNGGLTVTGVPNAQRDVAGDHDGEHWIKATWDPSEFDRYQLGDTDREFLKANTAAIAYKTEPGGIPQIEYFTNENEMVKKWDLLRSQHGTVDSTIRPNTEKKILPDPPEAIPEAPEPPGGSEAPEDTETSPVTAEGPSSPASEEPAPEMQEAGDEKTEEPVNEEPDEEKTEENPIAKLMPPITAPDDDVMAGEHPDNEIYVAIRQWAETHEDEKLETPDGPVILTTLNFENQEGFDADFEEDDVDDIMNFDFKVQGSTEVLAKVYQAIVWPNLMVTIYDTPNEAMDAWQEIKDLLEQESTPTNTRPIVPKV